MGVNPNMSVRDGVPFRVVAVVGFGFASYLRVGNERGRRGERYSMAFGIMLVCLFVF